MQGPRRKDQRKKMDGPALNNYKDARVLSYEHGPYARPPSLRSTLHSVRQALEILIHYMSSQTEPKLLDVQETLTGLNISTPTPVVPLADPNPWQDARSDILQEPLKPTATTLDVADLSSLDPVAKGLAAEEAEDEEPEAADTRQGILEEFDPLASHEEQAAKEAWESSHSQPPPQQSATDLQVETQTQQLPVKPAEDTAEQSRLAAGLSSFPTLAALARTFALPLSSRQRPRSLDTAASVPSPATLSS